MADDKAIKEVEAKLRTELVEGNLFNKKQIGSIDFEKYLEHAKLHKITWKMDLSRWNLHVRGNDYLSKQGISKILSKMKNGGYADGTIHHVLKLIKRLFNWSIENGYYYDENPCDSIKPPKYDNRVTDYFSIEETKNLFDQLDKWDNIRAVLLIKFAFRSGKRKGEITKLEWSDIDFANRTITCRQTKNGKTQIFPLNQLAIDIVKEAYDHKISEYVFPSSSGKNYYNGFSLAWKRLKKRIDIPYRFHDIRHSYASHLVSSGKVSLYELKALLGHSDYKMTQRYAHLTDDTIAKANNVIDELDY
jgi:integrase